MNYLGRFAVFASKHYYPGSNFEGNLKAKVATMKEAETIAEILNKTWDDVDIVDLLEEMQERKEP